MKKRVHFLFDLVYLTHFEYQNTSMSNSTKKYKHFEVRPSTRCLQFLVFLIWIFILLARVRQALEGREREGVKTIETAITLVHCRSETYKFYVIPPGQTHDSDDEMNNSCVFTCTMCSQKINSLTSSLKLVMNLISLFSIYWRCDKSSIPVVSGP